jgi:hypothetical protein
MNGFLINEVASCQKVFVFYTVIHDRDSTTCKRLSFEACEKFIYCICFIVYIWPGVIKVATAGTEVAGTFCKTFEVIK